MTGDVGVPRLLLAPLPPALQSLLGSPPGWASSRGSEAELTGENSHFLPVTHLAELRSL